MASHATATELTILSVRYTVLEFSSIVSRKLNQKIDCVSSFLEALRHEIYICVLTTGATGVIHINWSERLSGLTADPAIIF